LRREAHMELSYFSQFRRRTVAEFLARVLPNENAATLSSLCELRVLLFKFFSSSVRISAD
jgi:hypothetical protein